MTTPRQLHFFCDRCGNHYSGPDITDICPPCHYVINNIPRTQTLTRHRSRGDWNNRIGSISLIRGILSPPTWGRPQQKASAQ